MLSTCEESPSSECGQFERVASVAAAGPGRADGETVIRHGAARDLHGPAVEIDVGAARIGERAGQIGPD